MVKKSALAMASVLICLLLSEAAVRLLHMAPGVNRIRVDMPHGSFESTTNTVLRYVPSPGSGDINASGFRDREYPRAKPKGTLRILVIGDSVGYGFCNDRAVIAPEDVFAKQLERNLARSSPVPVEVINLCVSGYDTVQEVEFLAQKGLALDPDIVLVAYCLNDEFDASAELNRFRSDPQFALESTIGRHLVLRSHLARLIWLRHRPARTQDVAVPAVSRADSGFGRLAALADQHGFKPVIVVFPLFEPVATYRWRAQHAHVAQLAARHGFPELDLLDSFVAESGGDLRRLQGRCNREHPDELGHRVAARAIETYLATHGFLTQDGNGAKPGPRTGE